MTLAFTPIGWQDYKYWQQQDKKLVLKINRLIDEIVRTPFEGIGKPEPLRQHLQGWWSRRIDDEHRLVYKVEKELLIIAQCRYHYSK